MGKGIDLARAAGSTIHADVLDDFKDQLLIVFLKRLSAVHAGLPIRIPLREIDDTSKDLLAFSIDPVTREFTFELRKKT